MKETLSSQELQSRAPVWEALADFWLDMELVDFQFDHIACVIAESPYSLAEVRDIHDYEIVPAVSANLLSVAGEWAGFNTEWLIAECRKYAARRQSPWFRARIWLQRPLLRSFTKRYWQQIIPRVRSQRSE